MLRTYVWMYAIKKNMRRKKERWGEKKNLKKKKIKGFVYIYLFFLKKKFCEFGDAKLLNSPNKGFI